MAESPMSALILENGVKKTLDELDQSTSHSSQLNILRFHLDTVLSNLNTVQSSCNGSFFSHLSQDERNSFQKSLIQINDCVDALQQQLQDNPRNYIEVTSQNNAELYCSLRDDGLPHVTISTAIPSSTIDVIIGRPIDDIESETRIRDYISDAALSTVVEKAAEGTEAPPNGDGGRRTVRRLSQQVGSLFSRNGLAIHPKPTTTNLNDEKIQPQPKSSAQQPSVRVEEISATEGWIKVSQITELD
jgi:hypothetical protein